MVGHRRSAFGRRVFSFRFRNGVQRFNSADDNRKTDGILRFHVVAKGLEQTQQHYRISCTINLVYPVDAGAQSVFQPGVNSGIFAQMVFGH